MANAINWFEIPANDFNRAVKFYGEVLGADIHVEEMAGAQYGFLPKEGEGVGGAIAKGDMFKPSTEGAKIYLNAGHDLSPFLERVETAGGKVVLPKTKVTDEIGYIAFFRDTEGNEVAFHSPS